MCSDLNRLKEFVRYVSAKGLINEDNTDYVDMAKAHVSTIKETLKRLAGVKTYSIVAEQLSDYNAVEVGDIDLQSHFTETHIDDKVLNVHDTLKELVGRKNAFESYIMNAIENESFANVKQMISEDDGITFDNPRAKLGYQVSQLSSGAKDAKLAHYLQNIGSKLSGGGTLDPMEYRAVKASLLSARQPSFAVAEEKEYFVESANYQKFIESFVKFDN
jgi:hypothetical protein